MFELIKLNDVYNDWMTGDGVFTDLDSFDVPWKTEDETYGDFRNSLNYTYHGNHSGEKNISPVVYNFIKNEVDTPRDKLANMIFTIYGENWRKLWEALQIEYNPLNNYDMVENETPAEVTHTITPAETTETITPAEITETITPAETTVETKPAKTITENEVSAFNSSAYEDNAKTTVTGDSSDKGSDVFSVNTAGSNKTEVDTAGSNKTEVDTAGSDVFTVQNERTLTRSGNIGITTSQQLLESEINLRKWTFFSSVFNDIDNILTLSIY